MMKEQYAITQIAVYLIKYFRVQLISQQLTQFLWTDYRYLFESTVLFTQKSSCQEFNF